MAILRSPKLKHAFARGHSALKHVDDPEGWVRGKAILNTDTGDLEMVLGLETDCTVRGVRGRMAVRIFDADGIEIAHASMGKSLGIPGKSPGKARKKNFSIKRKIPTDVAIRAAQLKVSVKYDGPQLGVFGIKLKDVADAVKIMAAIL